MDQRAFRKNRQRLSEKLSGVPVAFSAFNRLQQRNDTPFPFVQESNFWYLTGIEEADWQLIIDSANQKSWLVAPRRSEIERIFDGGMEPGDAQHISGVDEVISADQAEDILKDLARQNDSVYALGADPYMSYWSFIENPSRSQLWNSLQKIFRKVADCRSLLDNQRAIKQPEEISAIQDAINVTIDAFQHIHRGMKEFSNEREIEAEFSYLFSRSGAQGHAYEPIVAAGSHAVTLHYIENNSTISNEDFVLMDIGAQKNGYSADITRTFKKDGLTARQEDIHKAVLHAHAEVLKLLQPGLDITEYNQRVDKIMKTALHSVGLLTSMSDDKTYRRYFPHAIGHGLGVDVHDSLGSYETLQPGMILTIEPGIYIPEEGIGVRLEDDILITSEGHRNMSAALSLSV